MVKGEQERRMEKSFSSISLIGVVGCGLFTCFSSGSVSLFFSTLVFFFPSFFGFALLLKDPYYGDGKLFFLIRSKGVLVLIILSPGNL